MLNATRLDPTTPVYAAYQHFRRDLHHPRGGRAGFQEDVLYEKAGDYYQAIADVILEGGGVSAMIDATERFAGDSGEACPKELTLLAHSDHPVVTDNGSIAYDRPPEVPRMSEAELRSLARLRPSQAGRHPYGRR